MKYAFSFLHFHQQGGFRSRERLYRRCRTSRRRVGWTGICATFTLTNNQQYQYQFNYYSTINSKPAWTAATYSSPITNGSGEILVLSNSALSGWTIQGLSTDAYPSSNTTSIPPLSNWVMNGSSQISSLSMVTGNCPAYLPLNM